jgi:hypothetical protein
VLCECERQDCIAQIEVPAGVHADVCASPSRFIVLPGHEFASEQVLARSPAYSIVASGRASADVTDGEARRESVGTWAHVAAPNTH